MTRTTRGGGPGILVLRALGVGDLATAVPALRGLRRTFPRERLWLAAPAWLAPLVGLLPEVDRLLPAAGLAPVRWPAHRWRLAVNLHGRGPESHRLLATARPGELWGFAAPAAGHADGPRWQRDEHEVQRWCRLLRWYGVPADRDDLALPVPARAARCGLTVVHPGAKSELRRWPAERYAAVVRALSADGHEVVVTGSATERGLAQQVAAAAGLPSSRVLAGRTGLDTLAGLVAGARLLVSGDTGVGHLATAYGTPSVLLFGPVPPRWWGPPADRPWHRALWHGDLLRVTVAEVLVAATEVSRVPAGVPAEPAATVERLTGYGEDTRAPGRRRAERRAGARHHGRLR